jgi:Protein of unknown function (DUF2934)
MPDEQLAMDLNSLEEWTRKRAYELYLQRGGKSGSAQVDWLQAQRDLLTMLRAESSKPLEQARAKRKAGVPAQAAQSLHSPTKDDALLSTMKKIIANRPKVAPREAVAQLPTSKSLYASMSGVRAPQSFALRAPIYLANEPAPLAGATLTLDDKQKSYMFTAQSGVESVPVKFAGVTYKGIGDARDLGSAAVRLVVNPETGQFDLTVRPSSTTLILLEKRSSPLLMWYQTQK